jgi:hypothetical protein
MQRKINETLITAWCEVENQQRRCKRKEILVQIIIYITNERGREEKITML